MFTLPTLPKADSFAFRRIEAQLLANLVTKDKQEFQAKFALVDCRYPYEYEGGHIQVLPILTSNILSRTFS